MTREIYPDGSVKVTLDEQDIDKAIRNYIRSMVPLIGETWPINLCGTIEVFYVGDLYIARPPKDAKP